MGEAVVPTTAVDMDNQINISISQEEYEEYLKSNDTVKNERISPPDVHFLDFIMSPETDLTRTSEGRRVIEVIKGL